MKLRSMPWLFPGLAMSLGWGLRGFIGGGPLGAMIPGSMVALAVCLLAGRGNASAAVAAAFGALGVGFGGEMTYGQTVGFIVNSETFWWGLLGLSVKGAVWGLLGGAVLGVGLTRSRWSLAQVIPGVVLMVAGTHLGWKLINEPKLIYFSNPLDRPRAEIWAGLLAGALLLLAWLWRQKLAAVPAGLAAAGFLGGGAGFGLGGALMALGRTLPVDHRWFDWWKLMEFTFGFLFGAALGAAARRLRRQWAEGSTSEVRRASRALPVALVVAVSLALGAAFLWAEEGLGLRYSFVVAATALLAVSALWAGLSWQIAITIPYAAAALDLVTYFAIERKIGGILPGGAFALITTLALSILVAQRHARELPMTAWSFLVLTWTSVGISWLKTFMHPWPQYGHLIVQAVFTVMAIALTGLTRSCVADYGALQAQPRGRAAAMSPD